MVLCVEAVGEEGGVWDGDGEDSAEGVVGHATSSGATEVGTDSGGGGDGTAGGSGLGGSKTYGRGLRSPYMRRESSAVIDIVQRKRAGAHTTEENK